MTSKKQNQSFLPVPVTGSPYPASLPVFTAMSSPLFPNAHVGLRLMKKEIPTAETAVKKYDGYAVMAFRKYKEINPKHPRRQEFYQTATLARILTTERVSLDSMKVVCETICRVRLLNLINTNGVIVADVDYPADIMPATIYEEREVHNLSDAVLQHVKSAAERFGNLPDELRRVLEQVEHVTPGLLSDLGATMLHASNEELQSIMETYNVRERLEKVLFLFQKDMYNADMKARIMERINRKIEKNQRVYMLQEMLREVKQELGNDLDTADNDIENFMAKLEDIKPFLSQEAEQRIVEEINKLKATNKQSPDYAISKNYLSWLTDLPWNQNTTDLLDVQAARNVLNRDHYGLDDVKKRILEFIAVAKLKGTVDGSIICLIGPPGVGKTSLGRCVAEALGRKFFRFSLGGMRDEAEIKGHRRTYIGAQPGKIISALKVCGSKNPVIMLDEIDKLGASYQGDPGSALLEVLDPEQNCSFRDHFLDIPFDLSQVLFIATANVRDTIPAPLLDRMEIITLSGYIEEEKLSIAKKHLIPKLLPKNGLQKGDIAFSDAALRAIIHGYARDSGVRSLENSIGACMRKIATKIADGKLQRSEKSPVKPASLDDFLGKPLFYDDPLVKSPKPGVAMGLAWTAMGGSTLYIEVLPIPGEPGLKITGQLGDVMKESTQIALSLVEKHASAFNIPEDFFKKHKLHIHVPAGATPKDGPSAGITIATAIISGATGKCLPPRWAMTGELTLTSRVLPVGGIKEKMIAARRAGVKDVILPKENQKDFLEINERAKEGLNAHYVSDYNEVFQLLFS